MNLRDAHDYFISAKLGEGISPKTELGYRRSFQQFVDALGDGDQIDVKRITVFAVRDFIRGLQQRELSQSTVARYVRELKVFCRWLRVEDLIPVDPFADRVKVPTTDKLLLPFIPDSDFKKLLAACNRRDHLGRRDYAILCFLWDTGVRVSELTGLQVEVVNLRSGIATVIGKGRKERTVFFSPATRSALLGYRARLGRLATSPYFFVSRSNQPLQPNAINQMLVRISKRAGVASSTNPHAFRHSFARNYLMAGGDLHSLQRLLGHATLEVVRLYLNLSTEDLATKHEQFSPMTRLAASLPRRAKAGF